MPIRRRMEVVSWWVYCQNVTLLCDWHAFALCFKMWNFSFSFFLFLFHESLFAKEKNNLSTVVAKQLTCNFENCVFVYMDNFLNIYDAICMKPTVNIDILLREFNSRGICKVMGDGFSGFSFLLFLTFLLFVCLSDKFCGKR